MRPIKKSMLPARTLARLATLAVVVGGTPLGMAQVVVAPSTWATNIVIEPTARDAGGVPIGSPSSATFQDWASIPIAVTDPADNPSALNIIDIKDVQVANDSKLLYIHVSGYKMRTKGVYLAFDTDQNVATGFDIYGLGLVGSELGYVSDFVFDQRTSFNDNKTNGVPDAGGSCCTGGPLDISNGGALLDPSWDVEFGDREWGIPLDALYSATAPFGPTFPNPTFNFIVWTDQGLTDVTDTIQYTLATAPGTPGDHDGDGDVDGHDFLLIQQGLGTTYTATDVQTWKTNFGAHPATSAGAAVPEPCSVILAAVALGTCGFVRRRQLS